MSCDPRFTVEPSRVLPGWHVVVDGRTGALVKVGRRAVLTAADAGRLAEKLNRNAVCLGCRHRRPAADMVGRRCPECRAPS